jgi:polyhydroxyalkanoate synthesis regulator phasin
MTTAIQQGTLTRSERRSRVQDLLAQLRAAEQNQMRSMTAAQERQAQEMSNVVEGLRGFSY